jgi:nickel-dependent lactate racemase
MDAVYFAEGSPSHRIDARRAGELLDELIGRLGRLRRVLLVPPDYSRVESWAGPLTTMLYEKLSSSAEVRILPAVGTHRPMTRSALQAMFPGAPSGAFLKHRFRTDVVRLGEVPGEFVREASEGAVEYPVPIEVSRWLAEAEWDRIFSIGQLVPHEVIGVANHVKNILVGTGGAETIHKTHYLGAVYGMERIMGRARTPVRAVLQEGMDRFASHLPITYVLTVRGPGEEGVVTRGLYAGDGVDCFELGAELCRRVNIENLDRVPRKIVVWLDPDKYASTWLGNKAVYRTRMAVADGGEIVVLAPGVHAFGEDRRIDRWIRKFGYCGTAAVVRAVREHHGLAANLSAAAHLIHGSTEGRFSVVYCPGGLTREEVEGVGYHYAEPGDMLARYDPDRLEDGWNVVDGEEVFFVRRPGQGLWTSPARDRLTASSRSIAATE